jgi:hypothetical protein
VGNLRKEHEKIQFDLCTLRFVRTDVRIIPQLSQSPKLGVKEDQDNLRVTVQYMLAGQLFHANDAICNFPFGPFM